MLILTGQILKIYVNPDQGQNTQIFGCFFVLFFIVLVVTYLAVNNKHNKVQQGSFLCVFLRIKVQMVASTSLPKVLMSQKHRQKVRLKCMSAELQSLLVI